MRGQSTGDIRTDLLDVGGRVRPGDQVGGERRSGHRVVDHDDDGVRDVVMLGDRRLHLAQFDSEPADLDLLVGAAEKVDLAGGVAAHQVTGSVQAGTGSERVGDKALGGQARPMQIATCQLISTQVDLAGHAVGNQPQSVVEDVEIDVLVGDSDRDHTRPLRPLDLHVCGRDHGFGGAVVVSEMRVELCGESVRDLTRERLTSHRHMTQGAPVGRLGQHEEGGEHRRHHVQHRDTLPGHEIGHVRDVAVRVGLGHHHARTGGQCHVDVEQ